MSVLAEGSGRRSERIRKVSEKMAVVDPEFQQQVPLLVIGAVQAIVGL